MSAAAWIGSTVGRSVVVGLFVWGSNELLANYCAGFVVTDRHMTLTESVSMYEML